MKEYLSPDLQNQGHVGTTGITRYRLATLDQSNRFKVF